MYWICLCLAAIACKKTVPPADEAFTARKGEGFYILNEGNFQWSNATISYVDRVKDTIWHDLFNTVNQSALGDVLQSAVIAGNKAYWVVNNSGKIVVTDAATLSLTGEISGLSSPRHMLWLNDTLAVVSDIYANRLSLVNPATLSISGTVPLRGWTEQMVRSGNTVWVTNRSDDFLAVVDPFTASIEDSIDITYGSHSIAVDATGMIWVLCTGKSGAPPALHRIDPVSKVVDGTFTLPSPAPDRLCMDMDGSSVWVASSQALYRIDMQATVFPAEPVTALSLSSLYGLSADPQDGVWVMDAMDYISAGQLYHVDDAGTILDTVTGGVLPNGLLIW